MSIEKGISTNSRPMPIVSSSDEDEASLVSSSPDHLLDTFVVNLSSIVDYDNAGICLSKFSSSTTTSSSKYYNDGVSLFMLGDYSEKGHFLPSANIIRNEVLEAYDITSSLDDDCNDEHDVQMKNEQEKCIAFRCVYCKHITPPTKRAAMAEIFPKNLMNVRETVIQFQKIHIPQCTFIPSDIRQCYTDFKLQEELQQVPPNDNFLWVSSLIRRGLRDDKCSSQKGGEEVKGIIYCPDVAVPYDLEESLGQILDYASHYRQANTNAITYQQLNYDIRTPQVADVLFQTNQKNILHLNSNPGNQYWIQLMRNLKPYYDHTVQEKQKANLVCLIVQVARNQNPPRRFLLQDEVSGLWNEIGDVNAYKKTSQALRELYGGKYNIAIDVEEDVREGTVVKYTTVEAKIQDDTLNGVKNSNRLVNDENAAVEETDVADALEIMNLFKEYLPGERLDNNDPIQLCPRKKRQKLESKESVINTTSSNYTGNDNIVGKQSVYKLFSPVRIPSRVLEGRQSVYHQPAQAPTATNASIQVPNNILERDAPVLDSLESEKSNRRHRFPRKAQKPLSKEIISESLERDVPSSRRVRSKKQKTSCVFGKDAMKVRNVLKYMMCNETSTNDTDTALAKPKPSTATSSYFGVCKKNKETKFEAKVGKKYVGRYTMEVDAALAHDVVLRANGVKEDGARINFATEQDYMTALEQELKALGIAFDLKETLERLSKVQECVARVMKLV